MKNRYSLLFPFAVACIFILAAISTYIFNYTIDEYIVMYGVAYGLFVVSFMKKAGSFKNLFTSIEFLYITGFSAYALMPAIQYIIDDGMQRLVFFSITANGIQTSIKWYYVVFLLIASILLLFRYPKNKKIELYFRQALQNSQHGQTGVFFDLIAIACLGLFIYSFLRNGISFFELDFAYRRKLANFALQQYVWLYMMVYSVERLCDVNFEKTILKKAPQILVIVSFWIMSSLIDRRHLIPVVVAVAVYGLLGKKKIDLKIVLGMVLFVAAMAFYAVLRLGLVVKELDFGTFVYEAFSEFILTGYITVYYATHIPSSYLGGSTYLWDTVTRIFPRVVFPWKPEDLAVTFMSSVLQNRVGFAFNPIAEGYLNFGNLLVLFVPLVFILFVEIGYKLSKKMPVYYLLFCAYFLDFNRGQFSNCMFDIIFMYIILFFMERLKVRNGRIN